MQTLSKLQKFLEKIMNLGRNNILREKVMATHSSILAWRIPMDREAWPATVHGLTKSDMTEQCLLIGLIIAS